MEEQAQYTRCPQCKTAFKVTSKVLSMAHGKVRCGACLAVFQASDYFVQPRNEVFAKKSEKNNEAIAPVDPANSNITEPGISSSRDLPTTAGDKVDEVEIEQPEFPATENIDPQIGNLPSAEITERHEPAISFSGSSQQQDEFDLPEAEELGLTSPIESDDETISSDASNSTVEIEAIDNLSAESGENRENLTGGMSEPAVGFEDTELALDDDVASIAAKEDGSDYASDYSSDAGDSDDKAAGFDLTSRDSDLVSESSDSKERNPVEADAEKQTFDIESEDSDFDGSDFDDSELDELDFEEQDFKPSGVEPPDFQEPVLEETHLKDSSIEDSDSFEPDSDELETEAFEIEEPETETRLGHETQPEFLPDESADDDFEQLSDNLTAQIENTDTDVDPLDEFEHRVEKKKTVLRNFVIGSVVLIILAFGSIKFWNNRQQLAWDDTWGGMTKSVCSVLPCDLKPRRDVANIKLRQFMATPSDDKENTLEFKILLTNAAPFDQPYPRILIKFSNSLGEQVATKRLNVSEYFPEKQGQLMPAGVEVHIRFETQLPHPDALGFEFVFE